jgi:hypothetical protein
MAAWLLWVCQQQQHLRGSLWPSYLAMLPQEQQVCCMLNFNQEEVRELQVPRLQVSRGMF